MIILPEKRFWDSDSLWDAVHGFLDEFLSSIESQNSSVLLDNFSICCPNPPMESLRISSESSALDRSSSLQKKC